MSKPVPPEVISDLRDLLARRESLVDRLEMNADRYGDFLSDEKIANVRHGVELMRKKFVQDRAWIDSLSERGKE